MSTPKDETKAEDNGPGNQQANYPDLAGVISGDTTGVEKTEETPLEEETRLLYAFKKALRVEFTWGIGSITFGLGFENLKEFHRCLEDLLSNETLDVWQKTKYLPQCQCSECDGVFHIVDLEGKCAATTDEDYPMVYICGPCLLHGGTHATV